MLSFGQIKQRRLSHRKARRSTLAGSPGSFRVISDPSASSSSSTTANTTTVINHQTSEAVTASLARAETRVVNLLRVAVLLVLLITASLVSTNVYLYTANEEHHNFVTNFESSAHQVIQRFTNRVEQNLGAVASLSTSITSYALQANVTFPFVTIPDFDLKGSDFRAQGGSHLVYWCPLVTNEQRKEWEEYSFRHRHHTDHAYERDHENRIYQDSIYFHNDEDEQDDTDTDNDGNRSKRNLQSSPFTIADNVTGFHGKIWSNGAIVPVGDEQDGSGPFLALWQQSPVDPRMQSMINLNIANIQLVSRGIIETMTSEQKAVLNYAATPIPQYKPYMELILGLSQYRQNVDEYIDQIHTILSYPVFDSFVKTTNSQQQEEEEIMKTRQVVGMLGIDVYWDTFLSDILPDYMTGIICVVENSFNQTFAYQIDGSTVTSLGIGDPHDTKYDDMEVGEEINRNLEQKAGPRNRAYQTVPISDSIQYTIRMYPSEDTENHFITRQPILYTSIAISAFVFASILFLLYSYTVEKRQHSMTKQVIANAKHAAQTERELNEFLSHEIRNPLSQAMTAGTFVAAALSDNDPLDEIETRQNAREDMEVVNSSLSFINDFLRSMLDIYRASGNAITIELAPTDILQDILDPVTNILHKRVSNFDVIVDCPDNLFVMTDTIRLKQVVLNLVRNSSKFVERGFLRVRADVVNHHVRLYVEDSGPGIPIKKRNELFAKYQESLDLLCQGTGIGLNLSKKLMQIMNGDLWLDDEYDSGIEGCPGSRFVIQLNKSPMDIESTLLPIDVCSQSPMVLAEKEEKEGSFSIQTIGQTNEEETLNSSIMKAVIEDAGGDKCASSNNLSSSPTTNKDLPTSSSDLPEGKSLLFVDDDAVLRKLFIRAVKKVAPTSWKIQEASSGETALRLCETELFDLIFLDQYMASTEKQLLGTETAQAMRAKGITSEICGLSANDLRDAFLKSGADVFVLKPIPCKPADLKLLLQNILFTVKSPTPHARQ